MRITLEKIKKTRPCYSKDKLEAIANGRKIISLRGFLHLSVPPSDMAWVLCHLSCRDLAASFAAKSALSMLDQEDKTELLGEVQATLLDPEGSSVELIERLRDDLAPELKGRVHSCCYDALTSFVQYKLGHGEKVIMHRAADAFSVLENSLNRQDSIDFLRRHFGGHFE